MNNLIWLTIIIISIQYKFPWSYSFLVHNSKSKKSIKNTCYFRVSSKRFCPKHFQSERFPQKGSPLLLAISLFISPIFGLNLSDCHFRRPLTFRSLLLFNILVHNCPKSVSLDIYPVSPTWYRLQFPWLVLPQVLHIFPAWNVNFLIGVTVPQIYLCL